MTINLRFVAIVALALLMTVPVTFAVITDSRAAEEAAHQARLHAVVADALKSGERPAFEGVAYLRNTPPGGKPSGFRMKVSTRDGFPKLQLLDLLRDGRTLPPPKEKRGDQGNPVRWMPGFFRDFELAMRNYRLEDEGTANVAGRDCRLLRLDGRHAERPTHRLWIDSQARMILKRESVGPRGRRSEGGFEEIAFTAEPLKPHRWMRPPLPPMKSPEPRGFNVTFTDVPSGQERQVLGFEAVSLATLPHGFERKHFKAVRVDLSDPVDLNTVTSLASYTDGIEVITVMQIPTEHLKTIETLSRVHKLDALWTAMSRGQFPREMSRRGVLARVEIGATTLLAAGSISKDEMKLLVSKFLDSVEPKARP